MLRKLFLENKDLCDLHVIERYYNDMKYFMSLNKIRYLVMDNELYADIDNNEYKLDYKIKRKVK